MEHARAQFAAEPLAQRSPPDRRAEPDDAEGVPAHDIVARLQSLDLEQLQQISEALGQHRDGADEETLRRSIIDWVGEWANDVAEERGEEDPEAARAAGHREAIGLVEEEIQAVASQTRLRHEALTDTEQIEPEAGDGGTDADLEADTPPWERDEAADQDVEDGLLDEPGERP
jgi:hypothetical protein